MSPQYIYKVFRAAEWAALQSLGQFEGSADDKRDGFIHFSLAAQLQGTLDKHYQKAGKLILAKVEAAILGEALIYETSRGGAKYPHLYAPLSLNHVNAHWALEPDEAGRYELPELEDES